MKAGKALDRANAQKAFLEAENLRLREESDARRPKSKKKVKDPPNGKFASLDDIAEAQEAPTGLYKRRRGASARNPAPDLEEAREEVIYVLHRLHEAEENQ